LYHNDEDQWQQALALQLHLNGLEKDAAFYEALFQEVPSTVSLGRFFDVSDIIRHIYPGLSSRGIPASYCFEIFEAVLSRLPTLEELAGLATDVMSQMQQAYESGAPAPYFAAAFRRGDVVEMWGAGIPLDYVNEMVKRD
jgi:hypothetical protein